jgi:DNA repair protein RecO (recombination protein O)
MHVDLQLYGGRSLDTVTQAVTLAAYAAPLAASYPAFTAAEAASLVELLAEFHIERAIRSLRLLDHP